MAQSDKKLVPNPKTEVGKKLIVRVEMYSRAIFVLKLISFL